jgi:hypothetical protein
MEMDKIGKDLVGTFVPQKKGKPAKNYNVRVPFADVLRIKELSRQLKITPSNLLRQAIHFALTSGKEDAAPIETAPKDGTEIAVPLTGKIRVFWCNDLKRWVTARPNPPEKFIEPTHWFPPPEEK